MFKHRTRRRTTRQQSGGHSSPRTLNSNRGGHFGRRLALEPLEDRRLLTASYTVTDLGTLPGGFGSAANGINAAGQVVGTAFTESGGHAFLYDGGTMHDLGMLPGGTKGAIAFGINASGQVVGASDTGSGEQHAFLYGNGTMHDIGALPGGKIGYALAINDNGEIVGEAQKGNGEFDAFLYSNGTMQDLGTIAGPWSSANGINASGQVAGSSDTTGNVHAFLYSNGTMHDLGTLPGGTYTAAFGINSSGQIVGYGDIGDGNLYAFLYSNGTMQSLGTLPGGTHSFAQGINDSGQVVGYAYTGSGSQHAFLYDDGAMVDLNSLIDPSSGWLLENANAINDAGQIVGFGMNASGQGDAFLLTPVVAAAASPQVTGVIVDSTSWSSGFLTALKSAGQGDGSGYTIPADGAAALTSLPWVNLNQIRIQFNENVIIRQDSLSVTGINVAQYAFADFRYDGATHSATWTLASPIGADQVSLNLKSVGMDAVTDTLGNPLGGAATNGASAFAAGSGASGGEVRFSFNVLPGDASQGSVVGAQAIAVAASNWLRVGGTDGDLNGDGIVNGQDLAAIASHWLDTLPTSVGGSGAGVAPTVKLLSSAGTTSSAMLPSPTASSSPVVSSGSGTAAYLSGTALAVDSVMSQPALVDDLSPDCWTVPSGRSSTKAANKAVTPQYDAAATSAIGNSLKTKLS